MGRRKMSSGLVEYDMESLQVLWNEASGQKDSRRDMKGAILLRTIVIKEVILKLQ